MPRSRCRGGPGSPSPCSWAAWRWRCWTRPSSNVALPSIASQLGASDADLSWIVSGYALAFGLALIPAGRLGDRIGHRWTFVGGVSLFTAASLACGMAGSAEVLVAARLVQGLAGGIFLPAVTALIVLMIPGPVRGRAFGIMGATIGFTTALGPILGGLLIETLGATDGWRSIFLVNLPIGVVVVLAALALVPGGTQARETKGGDAIGLGLLTVALVAILAPLIWGGDAGWPAWSFVVLAGGVVLLLAFVAWERHVERQGRTALVPPTLFSNRGFSGGVALSLVYFASFTSIFFTVSILWQTGLGHSALDTGLVSLPFALGSLVGAWNSDAVAQRIGRTVLHLGTGLLAAGLVAAWVVVRSVDAAALTGWHLALPFLIGGLGAGLFIGPNLQFIVATVGRADAGAASGVISTAQRIGASLGIAVIGSAFFASLDPATLRAGDVGTAYLDATAVALALSAAFAIVAFLLVFALPRQVQSAWAGRPPGRPNPHGPGDGARWTDTMDGRQPLS